MEDYNAGGGQVDPNPKKGQEQDKEYDKKPDEKAQQGEESKSVTPTHPDVVPHDNTRDAKDRFDGESPAQKDQPNRIDPEPIDEDGYIKENPDEDDSLEDMDPDAHKNIK